MDYITRPERRQSATSRHFSIFSTGLRYVTHSCHIVLIYGLLTTRLLQLGNWMALFLTMSIIIRNNNLSCECLMKGERERTETKNGNPPSYCSLSTRQIWNNTTSCKYTCTPFIPNRLRRGSVSKPYWWVLWQAQDETFFFLFLF